MKIKITNSQAYHEAMLSIAYLSNKGESNLAPLEYKNLVALCKAAERYEYKTTGQDGAIHEEQTTSSSFVSALYYPLFEFIHALALKFQERRLQMARLISKWVKFVQVAELSSRRAC